MRVREIVTVVAVALVSACNATVEHAAPAHAIAFPSYARHLLLETTSETSANVSFGDLDGDGALDILLAKGRHWPLVDRVLLGDGHGGIRTAYDLGPASDRSYSAQLADMNGDGSLDVVVSNDTPDPKLVYLNDGRGKFHVGSRYGRPEWQTRNASVADLNGDGRPDIIVANRSVDSSNFICFNQGGGQFGADCTPIAHYAATTITPADLNHDGLIDLVIPNRNGGQSYVYVAGPRAQYSNDHRVAFGPAEATIRETAVADFDGDSRSDIVASDEQSGVTIYFGEPGGRFSSGALIGAAAIVPYALTIGDLNGDGRTDIVVGHINAPSTIYFNTGAARSFVPQNFGDNQGTVYGFDLADFDHDGLLDIGVARSEAPNMVYFASR